MNGINKLSLDEQLKSGTTRRTVVTTGAKLAYAAPLVAASFALTARGALAACGGQTPIPFTGAGGEALCCGCCPQTGLSASALRAQRRVTAQQAPGDFTTCQNLLGGPSACSRTGNPRVCIAENADPDPVSP
jgi:hypothetical protein